MQTVLLHLLCCSEVAISLLDHSAGNLELSLLATLRECLLRGQNAAGVLAHESVFVHCLLPLG